MTRGRCERLREALAGDDQAERAALEEHAASCAACADEIGEVARLAAAARAWRDEQPEAPPSLERRVTAAIAREALRASQAARPARGWPRPARPAGIRIRWARRAAAAAALVAATAGGIHVALRWSAPPDDLARAVLEVEEAERAHAKALARLELGAEAVLRRAGDPTLGARQAAILLSYRDRLAHLDGVIAEVRAFLDEHPGHSGGHTVLLAAYAEKSEALREVLDLNLGDRS